MKRLHVALFASLLTTAACGGCGSTPSGPGDGGRADVDGSGGDGGDLGSDDAGADAGLSPDAGDGGTGVTLKLLKVSPPRGPSTGGTPLILNGAGFVFGFAEVGDKGVKDKTQILFAGNPAL